jgi:hypothetical protein
MYAPRIHAVLSGWLVQSGLGRFPVAPEVFNAVLGQLARWFYPFGSGSHCNNYYYTSLAAQGHSLPFPETPPRGTCRMDGERFTAVGNSVPTFAYYFHQGVFACIGSDFDTPLGPASVRPESKRSQP